jgi:hypothetical protein
MMRAFQKWTVVLTLMISIATPWSLLQTAAWCGMLMRYSQSASLSQAIEMTFDGEHPCQLCKWIRQGQQEEREKQNPVNTSPESKFQLALPPTVNLALYPPSRASVCQFPESSGRRPMRPPTPPPRSA